MKPLIARWKGAVRVEIRIRVRVRFAFCRLGFSFRVRVRVRKFWVRVRPCSMKPLITRWKGHPWKCRAFPVDVPSPFSPANRYGSLYEA